MLTLISTEDFVRVADEDILRGDASTATTSSGHASSLSGDDVWIGGHLVDEAAAVLIALTARDKEATGCQDA